MSDKVYLAADLGASSGRVLAGLYDGRHLRLEEVHRFENGPVNVNGTLHWDVLSQWQDILRGLRAAASRYEQRVRSVGVDTWGVDFGLLGRGDVLLANPVHYRDHRTDGMPERAFETVSREEIYRATGLQFMKFNTLYQLLAMRLADSPVLEAAESLLMMPDLFHWLLTGIKSNEFTNATTTQFYDPCRREWAFGLLEKFALPTHILGPIVQPGTRLGRLAGHVAADTNLAGVDVVAPGTHDTASAVLAVPTSVAGGSRPTWCYISSGTWSLMGVESPEPVINERCAALNFTNEGGVGGTIRLLKNIGGLWLVQECRRVWAKAGREYTWDGMTRMADAAPPLAAFIHPDDVSFMAPTSMPEAIREYCQRTGQRPPVDEGAIIRCALESLALRYRQVLEGLETVVGGRIDTIHVVGGGTQNRQLCQMTANACQRRVLAGPVEATALGNVLAQMVADGSVGSIAEARQVIGDSFGLDEYTPREAAAWDEAYARYRRVTGN